MKKKKRLLKFFGLLFAVFALVGCTKSFCSTADRANLMYYYETNNIEAMNKNAGEKGFLVPTQEFTSYLDAKVEEYVVAHDIPKDSAGVYQYGLAKFGGFEKNEEGTYQSTHTLWYNWNSWYAQARIELGVEKCPSADYVNFYKTTIINAVSSNVACFTPEGGEYGHDKVYIEGKTWGEAFSQYGAIEGLLVYPIGWLLHTFSTIFGAGGWGQVLAIGIVTLIVRAIIVLVSIKTTMSQQKMTLLQPEIQKISNKYPNAKTNAYDKQRLSQEQMALYKKHKIHPFAQFAVMIFQFPIFIGVWGAMQGAAILTQGEVFGLSLITTTSNGIMAFNSGTPFAIVLFLMLTISQFFQTKITFWFQDWQTKGVAKLGTNPSGNTQAKTMRTMSTVMMIFISIMGLTLPAAMGIYWFFGALISITQTIIMQVIMIKSKNRKPKIRKDNKKYERIRK